MVSLAHMQKILIGQRSRFSGGSLITGLLLLTLIATTLTGCGGSSDRLKVVPVSGVVTFNGQPLPNGSLLFVPVQDGPSAQAILKSDGTFSAGTYETADGVVPGEYQVSITAFDIPVDQELDASAPSPKSLIPDRYRSPEQSGLTATITGDGKNELRFELTP